MAGGASAFCLMIESNIHLTCSCPVSRPCTQTQVCSYLHTDMHTQGRYLSCEQGHECEPANYPLNSIQHIYPSIVLFIQYRNCILQRYVFFSFFIFTVVCGRKIKMRKITKVNKICNTCKS